MDIAAWLQALGLERYAEAFAEHDIDADILPKLTAEDLSAIGVDSVGHRRKLLEAISDLQEAAIGAEQDTKAAAGQSSLAQGAERRQLTVLFCDLVGSTELAARLDPEDMGHVIRTYHGACTATVERWGGHVAKYMGDGVLAYFGWPQAHEDEAERAVRSGLALIDRLAELETPAGATLAARVGIATGLVMVGELIGEGAAKEQTVVGETPNLAARLQALAVPGSVVISQATRRLVGGLFELADLGPRWLKGFAEPLAVWRVVGEGRAEGRFEALHGAHLIPLIGREHELGVLLDRFERAREGEGQVVLLVGEAGIGKSRIVRALRERLANQAYTPLRHYCSPYHTNSPLYPVIGLLERAAGFEREDSPAVRLAKLEALLALGSERLEEVALVAALLGVPVDGKYPPLNLTPQRQKQRTLEVLIDQMAGLAARQPVLAVYEDVHWMDPTTLEALGLLMERVQRLPVLVLITFRPEFSPPWSSHPHVMQLSLTRLTRGHGAAMVERLTGGKTLPPEVLDQILSRTDGVPLFVEELTKTVLETGLLRDAGDCYEVAGPLPPLAIPSSLHDSLMARLDRLAPVKQVAQTAAVIGRTFSQELLAAVSPLPEDQLGAALDQLVSSELIFRRGAPPDSAYSFKHALVQDVAYQSLLKSNRQELHALIADVLEERFLATAAKEPELLAHHFTEAGRSEQALDYWSKAGQRALERSAYPEAMAHLATGLTLLEHLPGATERRQCELNLQIPRAQALKATRGYTAPETSEAFARARQLCRELGDITDIFPALQGVWGCHFVRAEHRIALDVAQECLGLAKRRDDSIAVILAHRLIGQTLFMQGEVAAGRHHLEQALTLHDPPHSAASAWIYGVDSKTAALVWLSQLLWVLGYPEQAWRAAQEGLGNAGPQGAFDLVHALFQVCVTRLLRREFEAGRKLADEAVASAEQHGLSQWTLYAQLMRDWARLELESRPEAIAQFAHNLSALRATGNGMRVPLWLGAQAGALARVGRVGDAVAAIAEALALTEQSEERWSEAELRRLKGEILLMQGGRHAASQAEACFLEAVDVAQSQKAGSWELRAASSLARLWAERGKRAEARDLLAPVYGWFTEGFDTVDLKDAKALLDELR